MLELASSLGPVVAAAKMPSSQGIPTTVPIRCGASMLGSGPFTRAEMKSSPTTLPELARTFLESDVDMLQMLDLWRGGKIGSREPAPAEKCR